MDPLILVAVSVVALVASLGAVTATLLLLLQRQATERTEWARERWELNTRFQAPQVAPMLPPPDTARTPVPKKDDKAEPVRLDLVGTVAA